MRVVLAFLISTIFVGCAASSPPPVAPVSSIAPEVAAVIAAAERLTSIAGPWQVREIREGTYADLWRGSSSDLNELASPVADPNAALVIWRIDLAGPNGTEELYVDASTGRLIDSIAQGH